MKTLSRNNVALIAGALLITTAATQALADQNGPYYATPSWDQKLQCDTTATCPRFVVLSNWGGAAVLDRETGLVWDKTPGGTAQTYGPAVLECHRSRVGGRGGWRIPSIQELGSLIDGTQTFPYLPAGHPFGVFAAGSYFWSGTTYDFGGYDALVYDLWYGYILAANKQSPLFKAWCVRGGSGPDIQGPGPQG